MWFDETGLPWVRPSPNLPTLTSALVYPSLVAFEGSNVSVGRGTPDAFQRFGAPWLDAAAVVRNLDARALGGVRFVVDSFTPVKPGDGKYDGRRIPGVKIEVTDRNRIRSGLVSASILAALVAANRDSLRIDTLTFDDRFGSSAARAALLRGARPEDVMRGRPGESRRSSRAARSVISSIASAPRPALNARADQRARPSRTALANSNDAPTQEALP